MILVWSDKIITKNKAFPLKSLLIDVKEKLSNCQPWASATNSTAMFVHYAVGEHPLFRPCCHLTQQHAAVMFTLETLEATVEMASI